MSAAKYKTAPGRSREKGTVMNNVSLIGRLTAEPEIRYGKDDMTIANFTLAVDRIGSDEADFIRCVAFGKSAEFVDDYFTKGLRVGVSGRIQTGRYEDKDGVTRYTTDIIVERLDFADGKKEDKEDRRDNRSRSSRRK